MPSAGIKPGNVPTARIGPILAALIRERWPYGGGHEILAEKVGCEQSTIATIIEQKWQGVEFDLADSLLCALGRWDIWHGELADIYPTKFIETCALRSCGKTFPEYHRGGRHPKRYCSRQCSDLASHVRRGHRASGERMRQRNRCLQGHRFTPENTRILSGNRRMCRICERDRRRRRYANDPILRAKKKEADRRRYEAKRAA